MLELWTSVSPAVVLQTLLYWKSSKRFPLSSHSTHPDHVWGSFGGAEQPPGGRVSWRCSNPECDSPSYNPDESLTSSFQPSLHFQLSKLLLEQLVPVSACALW